MTGRQDGARGDTALVTGAAGFIGARLVAALAESGRRVVAVDRVPWDAAERLHPLAGRLAGHYHQVDLRDTAALGELVAGSRWVFHLAANTENRSWAGSARADLETTVGGTVSLVEACAHHPPEVVVMTSSQLVYGDQPNLPEQEEKRVPRPTTRFGAGKAAAEAFLSAGAAEVGFTAIAARLSNIIGPGMRRGIVYDFVTRLAEDPSGLEVLGDGRQTRSYLHVSDCVTALTTLAGAGSGTGRGAAGNAGIATFDVCNTDVASAAEVARIALSEHPSGGGEVRFAGGDRGWRGDVPTLRLTPQRLSELGWRPRLSSAEAVRAAVRELAAELGGWNADGARTGAASRPA